jgi:hypothetical protein
MAAADSSSPPQMSQTHPITMPSTKSTQCFSRKCQWLIWKSNSILFLVASLGCSEIKEPQTVNQSADS